MRYGLIVVIIVLASVVIASRMASAQAMLPWANTDQAIADQNKYNQQQQRLSPRNRVFLAPTYYQKQYQSPAQYYDATTINRYIMGYPSTGNIIRPVVKEPMSTRPGTGETLE